MYVEGTLMRKSCNMALWGGETKHENSRGQGILSIKTSIHWNKSNSGFHDVI